MEKHFVTFYSPGTFMSEATTKPIDSWNVDVAISMARGIKERHGATPYGFRFSTRSRSDDELDSKETASSAMHYLGGRIETFEEVMARKDPNEKILRINMENNGIKQIIVNNNSWRFTAPFNDGDVLLDFELDA